MNTLSALNPLLARDTDPAAAVAAGGALIVTFIVFVAFYVFYSWTLMLLFKRAGMKGWYAWVPYVNEWKKLEMGGQMGFWFLIPFAQIIFLILAINNINKAFGKSVAWTLMFIFLYPVWALLMAFDKAPWNPGAAGFTPLDHDAKEFGPRGAMTGMQQAPYGAQPGYGVQQPPHGAQPGYGAQPNQSPYGRH